MVFGKGEHHCNPRPSSENLLVSSSQSTFPVSLPSSAVSAYGSLTSSFVGSCFFFVL